MSRPFHYHLCRNTESQSITDECASPCVCAEQSIFRRNLINALITLVIGLSYRLIYLCQLAQLFQVIVHLLIADNGQHLVSLKMYIFVLFEDCFAMVIQLNNQTIGSLDGGNLYVVSLNIACAKIIDIGIPQSRKAAEQEHITHSLKILLILWNITSL